LAQKCGVGSAEISTLVEKFDSVDEIYEADFDTYADAGISERLAEDLCDKSMTEANQIIAFCQASRVGILCYDDERYPSGLRSISNPPAVLYYSGTLPDFNKNLLISMVGTRRMSEYGKSAAYKIAYEVASSGAIVVSGMALGIDGVCSAAAIAAGGKTVAVLGCGIDKVYPPEHDKLMENIKRHGLVITEFAPHTEPVGDNFPIRNRIISGISPATVVVDADLRSGALITAKCAILQGRDIYAVPSNIDSQNSSGTNSLIRDGAQAVLCGNDIIKNYASAYKSRINTQKMRDAQEHSELDESKIFALGARSREDAKAKRATRQKSTRAMRNTDEPSSECVTERKSDTIAERKITEPGAYEKAVTGTANYPQAGDRSREVLETLSEKQRRVFEEMPLDFPVTVDYLTKTGLKLGEVIAALTVLEVKGLVVSLPGAIYLRR